MHDRYSSMTSLLYCNILICIVHSFGSMEAITYYYASNLDDFSG